MSKKWELALFVQVTTAVFISSRFHSAVVTCTNKDNSPFFYLFWTTSLKYTVESEYKGGQHGPVPADWPTATKIPNPCKSP